MLVDTRSLVNDMNKLFLHVGPHKTGTTSIQKFLLDNRVELFKSNLVYPKRFQTIFGHHKFRDVAQKEAFSDEDLAFFNDESSDFLISSEDFISLNKQNFEYLRNAFESKQVIVLFTWRRASFKLYSIWQETVKHGGTQSFFAYYHEHLARPAQSQMLSADIKLNMFCNVFGKNNVKIIDYESSTRGNTLLQDFVSCLDLEWDPSFVTPENNSDAVNRSMKLADIEIIRALNQIFSSRHGKSGAWVRNKYNELTEQLESLGIAQLKEIILTFQQELTVGNYFIDHRCEKIMAEKFKNNMLNYEPNISTEKLLVAQPDWVFDTKAQEILDCIVDCIKGSD